MDKQKIQEKIIDYLLKNSLLDNANNVDVNIKLELESLAFVDLIVNMEDEFEIEFEFEELSITLLETINKISEVILKKL